MKSASLFDILPLMEKVTLEEVNAFVKNLDKKSEQQVSNYFQKNKQIMSFFSRKNSINC